MIKNISAICLDTSFIESQNFMSGSKLNELLKLAAEKVIILYITDIIHKEALVRFSQRIKLAEEKTRKISRETNQNLFILKNFSEFSSVFVFPPIAIEEKSKLYENYLENLVSNKIINILPTSEIKVEAIVNDYFNNKPPFKEGEKKSEFPDAINLKALEQHSLKTNLPIYFITADKDFSEYKNQNIHIEYDAALLIDSINRKHLESLQRNALSLMEEEFSAQKGEILNMAQKVLLSAVEDEYHSYVSIEDLQLGDIENISIDIIELGKPSIIHISPTIIAMEVATDFRFAFAFSAFDYSDIYFDEENIDLKYQKHHKHFETHGEESLTLNIKSFIYLKDKTVIFEIFDSSGMSIDVFKNLYYRDLPRVCGYAIAYLQLVPSLV